MATLLHLRLRLRRRLLPSPKPLNLSSSLLRYSSSTCNLPSNSVARIADLKEEKIRSTVSALAKEIISSENDESTDLVSLLESRSAESVVGMKDGSAFLQLLSLLKPRPLLALQVFEWRRKLPDSSPLMAEEYASAIALAGRAHNLSLANQLFTDSISQFENFHDSILYNSLMAAYMYDNNIQKTQSLFDELGNNPNFKPDTASYNILLSLYSHHMLINHMESILHSMDSNRVSRNIQTYNILISGYLISRNFEKMEMIFDSLKEEKNLKPDVNTHLLMLRGYAIFGELEKMESIYESVKMEVITKERSLLFVIINTYCNSKCKSRLEKIEELMKLVKKEEIFPWIHVVLIRVYAEEGSLDEMERLISQAFERKIIITSLKVVRKICAKYFSLNKVDRLNWFIKKAELAGWSLSKDLYQCKMVLYAKENRLMEMKKVADVLDSHWPRRDKRTLVILHKAYLNSGLRFEADSVSGLLWKSGFEIPSGVL
ncbi:hypothetical protein LUZ60_003937 [Juncus effusus]|nr:hypothetical protein LUZ60_003937 [Juncus effusus]